MKQGGPLSPYEVYCYRCNVTAPVGARVCVHCGGRLSGKGNAPSTAPVGLPGKVATGAGAAGVAGAGMEMSEFEPVDVEETPSRFSPMTILWVLLGLGLTLGRLCGGSPG